MEDAGDLRATGQDDNRLKKAVEASEKYRQKLESAEARVKTLVDQLNVHMTITERDNSRLKEERDGLKKKLEVRKHESAKGADRLKKDQENDNLGNLADRLKRAEAIAEKYRNKLEETADIRRTFKAMEQENWQLVERIQMVEDEYRKVAGYKALMENYKKQIDALQIDKAELVTQNNKLEFENKYMRSKIEAYEVAHARDMETIHLLEDRVREMELDDGELPLLDYDETKVKGYNDELSRASKGSTMTSLRIKVHDLERELTRLRESRPADGNTDAELLMQTVPRTNFKRRIWFSYYFDKFHYYFANCNFYVMEQENRQLVERIQMVEDENYKKQNDALQIDKAELVTQNNKLEFENKHMRSKIEAYEVAHAHDMETIHLLEDRVKEMELDDGEPPLLDYDKTEVIEDNIFIDDEISYASKGSTMTSLRIKVLKLERELTRLRESKPADGNADAELFILQNMLEDANRAKKKLQKDYDKVQKEKISLESELRLQQNCSISDGNRFERELTETK
ncbi:HOOK-domain-containing protein [Gigaspora margarita]|uniref:HOOK-domain-containing protein n=1 Tax=Gigaspora margarita TaxID=4874 RepID=A0A8H4A721_GIGMA|nr:HOOK-domain-containing protein [Gigaspora margarita]